MRFSNSLTVGSSLMPGLLCFDAPLQCYRFSSLADRRLDKGLVASTKTEEPAAAQPLCAVK
jgi:hypothetical protein